MFFDIELPSLVTIIRLGWVLAFISVALYPSHLKVGALLGVAASTIFLLVSLLYVPDPISFLINCAFIGIHAKNVIGAAYGRNDNL